MYRLFPLIFLLVACVPQAQIVPEYRLYLGGMIGEVNVTPYLYLENEDVDCLTYAQYFVGPGLKVSVNLERYYQDPDHLDTKADCWQGPLLLTIKGTLKSWVGGQAACLPIPQQFWPASVQIIRELLSKYPNTRILELGSEPDTNATWGEYYLGCWGTSYSDGVYYGNWVAYVYSQIKPDYPHLEIIGGSWIEAWENTFAEGTLSVIASDGISFHSYAKCLGDFSYPRIITWLSARTDKPLHLTEHGFIYADSQRIPCDQLQAQHVETLLEYEEITSLTYYTLYRDGFSWQNTELCNRGKPACQVYQDLVFNKR